MAAAARQVHVEQDDVREAGGDPVNRGLDVLGLPHHLHLVAELGPDPGPEEGVVIDDEHARFAAYRPGTAGNGHARLGWRLTARRGMCRDTSVPSPGALRTVAEPPRRRIRAHTDSASPLRSPGTAAGSNPQPRSRTNSDTSAGSASANSDTSLAPDHFAALTVASRAAASTASRSSSSSQSPTVMASTVTP